MDTKEKLEKLTDEDFQMYLGVKRKTFYASLEVLENQSAIEHKHGGKPMKTSVFDRLVITLNYYCEYRTMRRLAIDYGISKSNVCKIIHWTEDALVDSGLFALQSKDYLADGKVHCVLIDASEVEVERPKKTRTLLLKQEEKAHLKTSTCCRYYYNAHYLLCLCARKCS